MGVNVLVFMRLARGVQVQVQVQVLSDTEM